jgi:5-methylcytosine-specific restriction endonuclease McrA
VNPFIFPKNRHVRIEEPGAFSDYRKYKPFLQKEFSRKCVYCKMPDSMRGSNSFGVDHYRPKSKFPALRTVYANLFYCCNACNSRKGNFWPKEELEAERFIPNPCDYQMANHVRFKRAQVHARSSAGEFMLEFLDLNDIEFVSFRETTLTAIDACESKLSDLAKLEIKINSALKKKQISEKDCAVDLEAVRLKRDQLKVALENLSGETL